MPEGEYSAISATKEHQSVVERYFVKRYKTDMKRKQGEDFCILEHSNRICIVTLADSHPITRLGLKVTKVDFQADDRHNRLDNKVSGKAKRGAQMISEGSPLCHLTCDNGELYTVYGCLRAALVEVNETLVTKPQLLSDKPSTDGFIAILLTRHTDHEREMSKLLTVQQYRDVLLQRKIKLDVKTDEVLGEGESKGDVGAASEEVAGMKTDILTIDGGCASDAIAQRAVETNIAGCTTAAV